MADEVELLKRLYDRFNARDMETLLLAMQEDVIWANGMEGGHVHGREGVRSYWTRQWAMVDPHVEPVEFSRGPDGELLVEVHSIVRDLSGPPVSDRGTSRSWATLLNHSELLGRFNKTGWRSGCR